MSGSANKSEFNATTVTGLLSEAVFVGIGYEGIGQLEKGNAVAAAALFTIGLVGTFASAALMGRDSNLNSPPTEISTPPAPPQL